jgi:hypothetical protein
MLQTTSKASGSAGPENTADNDDKDDREWWEQGFEPKKRSWFDLALEENPNFERGVAEESAREESEWQVVKGPKFRTNKYDTTWRKGQGKTQGKPSAAGGGKSSGKGKESANKSGKGKIRRGFSTGPLSDSGSDGERTTTDTGRGSVADAVSSRTTPSAGKGATRRLNSSAADALSSREEDDSGDEPSMNVGERNDLPPQQDRDHDENENAPSIMVDSSAAENKPLTGKLDDATAGEWARQGTVKRKQATIMVFGMLGQDLDNRKKFSQSEMEIKRKRGIEEMPGYIATCMR